MIKVAIKPQITVLQNTLELMSRFLHLFGVCRKACRLPDIRRKKTFNQLHAVAFIGILRRNTFRVPPCCCVQADPLSNVLKGRQRTKWRFHAGLPAEFIELSPQFLQPGFGIGLFHALFLHYGIRRIVDKLIV